MKLISVTSLCIWALALLKSLFHPQLGATGKWAKLGTIQWNWLSLHKLWFLKSISSSEGTYVKAGNKMAKWSHMVSSSKTPDRLPSLIIMLLTSLHKLSLVSHAVVMKELGVGREKLKASFLIAKERTQSKLTSRSLSSKTKFMTTLCLCTFELNHQITLEKNYQMLFLRAIWYGDNVESSHSTLFSVVMTSSDMSTFFLSWPQLQPWPAHTIVQNT
jgi:hypothetical protein